MITEDLEQFDGYKIRYDDLVTDTEIDDWIENVVPLFAGNQREFCKKTNELFKVKIIDKNGKVMSGIPSKFSLVAAFQARDGNFPKAPIRLQLANTEEPSEKDTTESD